MNDPDESDVSIWQALLFNKGRRVMPDLEGLREFTKMNERDRAPFFTGREKQLEDIEDAVDEAMVMVAKGESVSSATRVFYGAPGAGKTSLLNEIKRRYEQLPKSKGSVVATFSILNLKDEVSLVSKITDLVEKNGACLFDQSTTVVSGFNVWFASVQESQTQASPGISFESLKRHLPPAEWRHPLILMVDEIQNVGGEEKKILQSLHQGTHDLPIIPVFAGLGNSIDVLDSLGLSRTNENNIHSIGALALDEAQEAIGKFLDCYQVKYTNQSAVMWQRELSTCSDCWPQHLHNGMRALAEGLIKVEGVLDEVAFDDFQRVERHYRLTAYRRRQSREMAASYELIARIMMDVVKADGLDEGDILDAIDLYSTPTNEPRGRKWQIPKGMDEDDFMNHLIYKGALHREEDKLYRCQIPSFAHYLIKYGDETAPRQEMNPSTASKPDDYEPRF